PAGRRRGRRVGDDHQDARAFAPRDVDRLVMVIHALHCHRVASFVVTASEARDGGARYVRPIRCGGRPISYRSARAAATNAATVARRSSSRQTSCVSSRTGGPAIVTATTLAGSSRATDCGTSATEAPCHVPSVQRV